MLGTNVKGASIMVLVLTGALVSGCATTTVGETQQRSLALLAAPP